MELSAEYKSSIAAALAQFKSEFPDINSISESAESLANSLISRSIRELKRMADLLFFHTDFTAPKRNSKISLSRWVAQVFLEVSELDCAEELLPFEDAVMPEIVEPEPAPIYRIHLLGEYAFAECLVSRTPPYLIDKAGDLFRRVFSPLLITNYGQVPCEHLSNIEVSIGSNVELLAENLTIHRTVVRGVPPLYLITKEGGAYKRQARNLINQNSTVQYAQVVSEYLSNIAVA